MVHVGRPRADTGLDFGATKPEETSQSMHKGIVEVMLRSIQKLQHLNVRVHVIVRVSKVQLQFA